MNPSGGDVSVMRPIEQSLLPLTGSEANRSKNFVRYVFEGGGGLHSGVCRLALTRNSTGRSDRSLPLLRMASSDRSGDARALS
jgi:hypothetical protein